MGVSCHKDYTENGKYENENDPEYIKNITDDLKLEESYLKYFLCQFVFGYREIVIANALGSIARNYNREEIYDFFKSGSVNKFRLKFTFPKNIK
ncbi:MAG: hypothetical protein K2L48_03255 [Mycoplasmoidaceae bacterium]|nr:hypothetical protein [Mycoplasmoidaceae bacterium]